MEHISRLRAIPLALILAAGAPFAWAQNSPPTGPSVEATIDADSAAMTDADRQAALGAELFYEILMSELTTNQGDANSGYALMLDAARRSNDARLYRRATEMALQSRSAESALIAANTWKQAYPLSRDANRFQLQILIILNRIGDTTDLLRRELALSPPPAKIATLQALPQVYGRASDKALAAKVVERALRDELTNPAAGPAAWVAIGRTRLAADNGAGALEAARKSLDLESNYNDAGMLLMELSDASVAGSDALLKKFMSGHPTPEARLSYARLLLQARRNTEALEQLKAVTQIKPDMAEAWIVQASLYVQDKQLDAAEAALYKYRPLVEAKPDSEARTRALAQGDLLSAQVAELRGEYAKAESWLARITEGKEAFSAKVRQAALLARQGKVPEARALLQNLPSEGADDDLQKLLAEVQILREVKQFNEAYAVQTQAVALNPDDNDLVYEQAMLAEKIGKLDEMEQFLRAIVARDASYHHAYNALGFSLADRGIRLPEARTLIQKALEQAPNDPFILDSLAWVDFRQGNHKAALEQLDHIFKRQRDAEIAAHLGEVLWTMGQRERALRIWQEGQKINADNDTLKETLQRFGVLR